ncbi:hypothetical protein D3C81_667400 [compost metagenome]
MVDLGVVTAEPIEGRAGWFEGLVERAKRQPFDQRTVAQWPLAPGLEAGNHAGGAVQRRWLEVRAAENCSLQAGAVVHQVGLGNVAAHAVTEEEYWRAGELLANVLAEQSEVVDHSAPAIVPGEQAEGAELGGTAMATLVMGNQRIACSAQRLAQALVAPGMFGHAMGQQHHRLDGRAGQPLVDIQAAVIAGR